MHFGMKHVKPFKPFNGELLDEEGYPTTEFLSWLRDLSIDNVMHPREVMATVKSAWNYADWGWRVEETKNDLGKPVARYYISTGGWSGNEAIINALQRNPCFWPLYWYSSRRGGHHVFEIPRNQREAHNEKDA
jgi:hypothetical protein